MANHANLAIRRRALIDSAGRNSMNYLRSMFQDGIFVDYPQEFFASIANQWFTDSAKTLELGLVRLAAGYPDPINQAVFFADVYSRSGDHTFFYTTDTSGTIRRRTVPLTRNFEGHIMSLFFSGIRYEFTVDDDGNVLDWTEVVVPPQITGIRTISDSMNEITVEKQTGSLYVLQYTTSLATPIVWTSIDFKSADEPIVIFETPQEFASTFYRIVAQ